MGSRTDEPIRPRRERHIHRRICYAPDESSATRWVLPASVLPGSMIALSFQATTPACTNTLRRKARPLPYANGYHNCPTRWPVARAPDDHVVGKTRLGLLCRCAFRSGGRWHHRKHAIHRPHWRDFCGGRQAGNAAVRSRRRRSPGRRRARRSRPQQKRRSSNSFSRLPIHGVYAPARNLRARGAATCDMSKSEAPDLLNTVSHA